MGLKVDRAEHAAQSELVSLGAATSACRKNAFVSRLSAEYGCEYCADPSHMLYGHVVQIGSNAQLRILLLRCPRCRSLYEQSPTTGATRRLITEEAAKRFPDVKLGDS